MKPMRILATLLVTIAWGLPAFAQSDETAKRFHVLPLIADGSGWQSFVLVTNVAQSASLCTVELHGLSVDRFGDVSGVTATGSTATFELAGRGGNLVWGTRNESGLASGYATLDCVAPVVAQVVLASIDESGATTGMATVFSSQAGAVFQFPVLTADAAVGFAIANDTDVDAACGLVLEDPQRVTLGEMALSAPSRSNVARMLNAAIAIPETFHGGSATVSCDRRVAMIGVHFELQPDRAVTTFNTLPLALLDTFPYPSDETAKRFHVLPHIADGSGWQSRLLVTNAGRATSQCTVELHGLTVDRFEDAGGVTAAGSTATFELGGAGGYLVWGTQNAQPLASGYATLDCTAPVVAQVVFASVGDSGAPTGMATVFSAQPGAVFQFPVLTPAGTLGFAIANDTNTAAECRILLEDPERMNLGEAAVSVPPKSSLEQMLNTAIAIPEGFLGGTARVGCNQQVAMTGIHMELAPNGDIITFNTLPPAVLDPIRPTVTLSASAVSIELGEATTMTWSSTNAASATITPDIGEVDPSGSRDVSPRATTTYQITVTTTEGQTATASVTVTVNVSERAVLAAFYEATGGETWADNTNWLTDRPLSEWHGVEVDGLGRVTELFFEGNDLTGSIPAELGSLALLTSLNMNKNDLTGPIPAELGGLVNLTRLFIGENRLTGPIPPEFGALDNLTDLSLRLNSLTGPIPPELGRLTDLTRLNLQWNNLTGPIPPELGRLTDLTRLDLNDNSLTGPIPPELGRLTDLTSLRLTRNNLTGQIPRQLGALVNLTFLQLGQNQLTGPIPPELGRLTQLWSLTLNQNELTGSIPPELGSLAKLNSLSLSENNLTGRIPPELRFLTGLRSVGLFDNNLTGRIPPELGSMTNLEILNLDSNNLTGRIPPELGSMANLEALDLGSNSLTGHVPPELAALHDLRYLDLGHNLLTGTLPPGFLSLTNLYSLILISNDGLCVPGTTEFVRWRQEIGGLDRDVAFCNDSDRAVLDALYESAGGEGWTHSGGWGGNGPLGEWYGVSVDALGRVTALDLTDNGLEGQLPGHLTRLSQLMELRVDGNALSGRLPTGLAGLNLRVFRYADTELCTPADESFQAWLGGIASHEGAGVECGPLTDREILIALYESNNGSEWPRQANWLTDRPLSEWQNVVADDAGRVTRLLFLFNNLVGPFPADLDKLTHLEVLELAGNGLTGSIPPELGSLGNLTRLNLDLNHLTGSIPPELGSLTSLEWLYLGANNLSGSIPPELGSLANLTKMGLSSNELTGSIPPELGRLTSIETLWLAVNELTGSIPPELGHLTSLEWLGLFDNNLTGRIPPELGSLANLTVLWLSGNELTGPIPPELGGSENLGRLILNNNPGMSGPLPPELTRLDRLEEFLAGDTGLCTPSDAGIQNWLEGVWKRRLQPCGGQSAAYLTQAVQSRRYPVPLVAGEEALLRVFVTAPDAGGARIPPVRARFYVDGQEVHVAEIPGGSAAISDEVDEGSLDASANARVPADVVQPGLEFVVEVDPGGSLGSGLRLTRRIPENGRLPVDVRAMPVFDLTVIPFVQRSDPDTSIVELVEAMAGDPEDHALLQDTRTLLPIGDLKVTAHESVMVDTDNPVQLYLETKMIRAMEGAAGHYMGTMAGPLSSRIRGAAVNAGESIFAVPDANVIAHELGHNLSLAHAPCGHVTDFDLSFPRPDGTIGAWGYDFREGGRLVSPDRADLMSYCQPQWIGDYHFTNALRYRLDTEGGAGALQTAAPARSLLLWGGVDAAGAPFVEPAFVVDALVSLPPSTGDYRIVGLSEDGAELFSLPFAMPEVADGDGGSSFAFTLPIEPGWAEALVGVTLSGPGGAATLDEDTNRPVTILRNPATGQVRGILRGGQAAAAPLDDTAPELAQTPAAEQFALPPDADVETLTSRGLPDPEDWR